MRQILRRIGTSRLGCADAPSSVAYDKHATARLTTELDIPFPAEQKLFDPCVRR